MSSELSKKGKKRVLIALAREHRHKRRRMQTRSTPVEKTVISQSSIDRQCRELTVMYKHGPSLYASFGVPNLKKFCPTDGFDLVTLCLMHFSYKFYYDFQKLIMLRMYMQ